MEVVSHFVSIGADERSLNFIDCPVEGIQGDMTQLLGEKGLQLGIEVFPEAQTPSDKVFPKSRLAFMHAGRCATGMGCAFIIAVDALLVQSVTHLVDRTKQRLT